MAFADLFSQAQLEFAVGGAQNLLQLADNKSAPTNDLASAYCQAFIAEVKRAAAGEVYSILQVKFNPVDPTVPAADFVQQNAVVIGAYRAWQKSTGGVLKENPFENARERASANLEKAAEGIRALGTDMEPSQQLDAHQVDMGGRPASSSAGNPWTRKKWGGFC